MNMITDTALLKHHRIDYGTQQGRARPRQTPVWLRKIAMLMIMSVALGLVFNMAA